MTFPQAVLVDTRSFESLKSQLYALVQKPFVGIDIETNDAGRHEGLNRLMAMDDEGFKSATKALIFDTERTVVTGISLYGDNDSVAYYINLAHADTENRLDFDTHIRPLLDSKPEASYWLAHNSPFELTMMFKSLNYNLAPQIICTMQLAVTCWNGDTYDTNEFRTASLGEIATLFPQVIRLFATYNPGDDLSKEQEELLGKVTAKESRAAYSYNGWVKTMAYGFGLKALSKRFLNYEQVTFEEVLNGRPHMGCLTGEEVCSYGADDAWVCVHLFHKFLAYLVENNPQAVETFFKQEAPMSEVYSKVWREGVRVDREAVLKARDRERGNIAQGLRTMKAAVKSLLPYPKELHEKLEKYDPKHYGSKGETKYRDVVSAWAKLPDSPDTFTQLYQVRGSASKSMSEELKKPESKGVNLTYYQTVRSILYDLAGCSFQLAHGKVQSDGDARDVMKERWLKKHKDIVSLTPDKKGYVWSGFGPPEVVEIVKSVLTILDGYKGLASSEQVIKLYITNYLCMIDPDTDRMYPQLSSKLDTRRLALSQPNLSQLAKNSAIAYIRGVFLPDYDDHVIISADWSSIELVIIGELSGDPEFKKAFGQLPYEDLHRLAASSVMDLTLEEFDAHPDKKKLRTDLGKGANFNYWYSGALGTIAGLMGWSSEEMWERVGKYRERFAVAEQWRVDTINSGKADGYTQLPDGHRRYKFEATYMWASLMRSKFESYGPIVAKFGDLVIRKVQTRAGNQLVNAKVQGTGATLMKRTALKMLAKKLDPRNQARFMFPVHDELVFSVHKDYVLEFIPILREAMCNQPEIFKNLIVNCSFAIGKNYWAWDAKENPKGQVEIDELQKGFPGFDESRYGQKLTEPEIQKVVDYLCG